MERLRGHRLAAHHGRVLGLPRQHDVGEAVLVLVLRVRCRLDHDPGEGDAVELAQALQQALAPRRLAGVLRIEPERAVDHGAEGGLADVPALGDALLVELAAGDREVLPELAPGEGAVDYGELAVEHPGVAGLGGLQQAPVHRHHAVDPARADGQPEPGVGAVRDELALRRQLRLGVVQIERR